MMSVMSSFLGPTFILVDLQLVFIVGTEGAVVN
jgi:hypothetical protein